jgi:hypothetical protein
MGAFNIIRQFASTLHQRSQNHELNLFIENEVCMYALFTHDYKNLVELCETAYDPAILHTTDVTRRTELFLENNRLAALRFNRVNIALAANHFTILPEAFALPQSSKSLIEFSSGLNAPLTQAHRFNHMQLTWAVDAGLQQALEKNFKNARISHSGAVAINLLTANRSLKKCDVFLSFNGGVFELLAKQNGGLLYYNLFGYTNKEDVLYYLLFMMEQFNLDPAKVKLAVAGQVKAESEIIQALKKYVRHVSFAVNETRVGEEINLPEHFYFTLLNQHLCEL